MDPTLPIWVHLHSFLLVRRVTWTEVATSVLLGFLVANRLLFMCKQESVGLFMIALQNEVRTRMLQQMEGRCTSTVFPLSYPEKRVESCMKLPELQTYIKLQTFWDTNSNSQKLLLTLVSYKLNHSWLNYCF